jgi:hypothetical protein
MSATTSPTPMDLLRAVSPEGAKTYMEHKAATMGSSGNRVGAFTA